MTFDFFYLTIVFYIFALGAIVGSFLNVVILRHNTGRNLSGRSGCMKCNYKLKWYDLVPMLSWIFLKGRCRKCDTKISIQYPLVELATAILFVLLFFKLSEFYFYSLESFIVLFLLNASILSVLVVIFVYDLYHKIISDKMAFIFFVLALAHTFLMRGPELINSISTPLLIDIFAGFLFFIPFWALWYFSDGTWIGLGDGKLAIGIGTMLGFTYGLSAIILGFWIGAIFAILLLLLDFIFKKIFKNNHAKNTKNNFIYKYIYKVFGKNVTIKTEIPFAPFLIIGFLIEFFVQIDFFGISNLF